MKVQRMIFLVSIALIVLPSLDGALSAQVDQAELARQIRTGDRDERNRAVAAVMAIGAEAGPELRAALIGALEREGAAHLQRAAAVLQGEVGVPPLEDPEFLGAVSRAVAELRDPQAIPALTGALGTGFTVIRALAAFGERAAPDVLSLVSADETRYSAVSHGLIALRFMVEESGTRPLDEATFDDIRSVARQRLATGEGQFFTTLWWAIDLAIVLDDPELRRIVSSLASEQSEVIERGITDPDLIEKTQARARDRLAGQPPLPRWN